ncbi:MAG: DNA translocase FtsK, partial [Anaerolineae bacterium]
MSLVLELPLSLMASWLSGIFGKVWRGTSAVGSATVAVSTSALDGIIRLARKAAPAPSLAGGGTVADSIPLDKAESGGAKGISTTATAALLARNDKEIVAGGNPDLPWELPRVEDMLEVEPAVSVSVVDLRAQAKVIEDTCRSLGVPVTVVEVSPGPVVTQFGLEPGYLEKRDRNGEVQRTKVKVSRIVALANDLALALAAAPVRIEAPVPGRSIVGLEVPNAQPAVVGLRGIMESKPFQRLPGTLRLGLGRDVAGKPVVDDLRTLPHLLVAGATGSGKSVCLSAIIASLLCQNTPRQLRMIMIDPKRVELSAFGGIPHLAAPVIVDMERAVGVLQWVLNEMDRRYQLLAKVGARNIQAFNEIVRDSPAEQLPSMVVLIDELADLMLVSADAVEDSICRLAQLARATGIHLIVATQRPSVDVVTGLIKANLSARIAFAVASQTDSRVILDSPGAETLLGSGDGLYMAPDNVRLVRMQGAWVSDDELRRIIGWWQEQAEALDWSPADVPDGARWDASDRMVQPR